MLPFQRDANIPGQISNDSTEGAENQDNEFVKVASGRDSVKRSTVIVAVLFVAGMLGLWFMIQKSTPNSATAQDNPAEEARVDSAITELAGLKSDMLGQMDDVVSKLHEFTDVEQVEVNELTKNPFKIEAFTPDMAEHSSLQNVGISAESLQREQMKRQAKELELQSIIQSGDGNCCMINGEILRIGDIVESFEVSQISQMQVTLTWLGHSGEQTEREIKAVLTLSQ